MGCVGINLVGGFIGNNFEKLSEGGFVKPPVLRTQHGLEEHTLQKIKKRVKWLQMSPRGLRRAHDTPWGVQKGPQEGN